MLQLHEDTFQTDIPIAAEELWNCTFKEKFYNAKTMKANSLGEIKAEPKKFVNKYNDFRQHFNLAGKTQNEYTQIIMKK